MLQTFCFNTEPKIGTDMTKDIEAWKAGNLIGNPNGVMIFQKNGYTNWRSICQISGWSRSSAARSSISVSTI